jgi:hypothetical protein
MSRHEAYIITIFWIAIAGLALGLGGLVAWWLLASKLAGLVSLIGWCLLVWAIVVPQ